MKHLHRSRRHRILFGVCGGLAEYLGVSVAAVRLVVIILSFVGSGVILYIAGMLIMPEEDSVATPNGSAPTVPAASSTSMIPMGIGMLLVLFGVLMLFDHLNVFSMHTLWHIAKTFIIPVAVIMFGVAMLMRRGKTPGTSPLAASVPLEQSPVRGGQWFRSRYDRKLFGVCAGIAHAMNVDPTVVRLAWVLLTLHSFGFGFIVYLILAMVLPEEPIILNKNN